MRRVLRPLIALLCLLAGATALPLGAAATPRIIKINATDAMQHGEYVFLCTFPAHHAGGMRGLLVVKG